MESIFAQRVKSAREMRRFSKNDLCERLQNEITVRKITQIEAGEIMPDSTLLINLANALSVTIDYFFRPITVELPEVNFRKKMRLGKKSISSIKEITKDKVERYLEAENLCGYTSDFSTDFSELIVRNADDVYEISKKLKQEWDLGDDSLNNLIDILEVRQVKVIEIDSPEEFDGLSYYVKNGKNPIIVVNKSKSVERKRFVTLYELGHILLHFDNNLDDKQIEKLCHLFASEMLISKEVFIKLIGNNRNGEIVYQELRDIHMQYGISVEELMYKAKVLKVISEQQYNEYCKKRSYDKYLQDISNERIKEIEVSNRFERFVYRALTSEKISESKASVLLDKPLNELRDTLRLI